MTTRTQAERVLFDVKTSTKVDKTQMCPIGLKVQMSPMGNKPERRRVAPIYCPRCQSWVEVLLQPVRLHCTRCGLEARP